MWGWLYAENCGKSMIVRSNSFSENMAVSGGGIELRASKTIITYNAITGNASYCNGGISCSAGKATITHNDISNNDAEFQVGGLYVEACNPLVAYNSICNNQAVSYGAAHFVQSYSLITNNYIAGNIAEHTGGIKVWHMAPKVINNVFYGNKATVTRGGALTSGYCPGRIDNNIFHSNEAYAGGGGIDCYGTEVTMKNNVFHGNHVLNGSGGGIFFSNNATVNLVNSIFWGNSASSGKEIHLADLGYPSTLNIDHCDVEGGQAGVLVDPQCSLNWGANMIDSDPLFVDPQNGDFHLTYPSPCRNSGDNQGVQEDADFEGDPRIADGIVDMGADEYHTHFYCTGTFAPLGTIEGKFVGSPGAWPVGLLIGSEVLNTPISLNWGDLYLKPPFLFVELVPIPASGVLVIPETMPHLPAVPYDVPMQGLIGYKLSNLFVMEVR